MSLEAEKDAEIERLRACLQHIAEIDSTLPHKHPSLELAVKMAERALAYTGNGKDKLRNHDSVSDKDFDAACLGFAGESSQ